MISTRTKKLAGLMRGMCLLLVISAPVAVALIWWHFDELLRELPGVGNLILYPDRIDGTVRLAGFLIHMIPTVVSMAGIYQLFGLFTLYTQGEVFSLGCVKRLRNFAYMLVAFGIASPVTSALLSVVLTMRNPAGERALAISLGSNDIIVLFIGGVFLVISGVMMEGRRLAEENAQIV